MSFSEQRPKKRMTAAVLFLNTQNEILIVKPVYRERWLLPGGIVEKDESPRQACIREIREELGFVSAIGKLLCGLQGTARIEGRRHRIRVFRRRANR